MLNSVSFSSAKRNWFIGKINFLNKENKISKTEICGSLNIFTSRLSKIINNSGCPVHDSLIDKLIEKYKFENPISGCKPKQNFSTAKRDWFVAKVNYLKKNKNLSGIDLCKILDILPPRLSYMLKKTDSPINDKYIDILIDKFGFENPVFCVSCESVQTEDKNSDYNTIDMEEKVSGADDLSVDTNSVNSIIGQCTVAGIDGKDLVNLLLDRILSLQKENITLIQQLKSPNYINFSAETEKLRQINALLEEKFAKWLNVSSDEK